MPPRRSRRIAAGPRLNWASTGEQRNQGRVDEQPMALPDATLPAAMPASSSSTPANPLPWAGPSVTELAAEVLRQMQAQGTVPMPQAPPQQAPLQMAPPPQAPPQQASLQE